MSDIDKRLFFDLPNFGRVHTTGGSIKLAGFKTNKETSDLGAAGESDEFQHGELKFKVKNKKGMSATGLQNLKGITVTVTDSNGTMWACENASTTENVELSDGEYDMTMMFDDQKEIS